MVSLIKKKERDELQGGEHDKQVEKKLKNKCIGL